MKTRRAQLSDIERIGAIHVDSWRAAYAGLLPDDFLASLDRERRAAMWRSCVERDGLLFVAEEIDGTVIGFACVAPGCEPDLDDAMELTAIYLDPTRYGSGAGSRLWQDIERQLTAGVAYLWVLEGNALGIAFYEKNGFRRGGRTKSFAIGARSFGELRYVKRLR